MCVHNDPLVSLSGISGQQSTYNHDQIMQNESLYLSSTSIFDSIINECIHPPISQIHPSSLRFTQGAQTNPTSLLKILP